MTNGNEVLAAVVRLEATYAVGHKAVLDDLAELKAAAKTTNGRVNHLEVCQALLNTMPADMKVIRADIDAMQAEMDKTKGALALVKWALAGGMVSLATLVWQLLQMANR